MPEIEITPSTPDGDNKWYTKGDITNTNEDRKNYPYMKITANSEAGTKLCYTLSGGMNPSNSADKIEVPITGGKGSTEIKIDKVGYTRITAWIEEGGSSSREASESIKFDNQAPQIASIEKEGTDGSNNWKISDVLVKIKGTDEGSGVVGYEYKAKDESGKVIKASDNLINIDIPIKIETDGKYKLEITLKDGAGNISGVRTEEVNKDTEAPKVGVPTVDQDSITGSEFTISIGAGDETSGISKYEYYVNGNKKGESAVGSYTITGLNPVTTYEVYIKVYDKAGLSTESQRVAVTTKVDVPSISIQDKDKWTNQSKTVTISKLENYTTKYTIDGTEPIKQME